MSNLENQSNLSENMVENAAAEETIPKAETTVDKATEEQTVPKAEPVVESVSEEETPKVEVATEAAKEEQPAQEAEAKEETATEQKAAPKEEPKEPAVENPYIGRSLEELIDDLQEVIASSDTENIRAGELIKQTFYKKLHESDEELPEGKDEEEGETPEKKDNSEVEAKFKELFAQYKEKKAAVNAALEEEKKKNLALKQDILDRLETLTNSSDDLSETIPAFRRLQNEWKEIGQVPQAAVNELWRSYNRYRDKFYDLIKINSELREYDFRKNLELKVALCIAAERLEEEPNPVFAFNTLQKLHEEWREVGPVAREEREAIWNRFKEASTVINKKHVAHFEALKEKERENLRLKTEICEKIEAINVEELDSHSKWEKATAEVLEMQTEWRTIGFATKKMNTKIFERFRGSCDSFFKQRNQFYKDQRSEINEKIDAKKALIDKVEALKEAVTADKNLNIVRKVKDIQKEWKEIGYIPKKQGDQLWESFREACDALFEHRSQVNKAEEEANLKAKHELIDKAAAYKVTGNRDEDVAALKAIQEEFNAVGFVNIKERKAVNSEFRAVIDSKFDAVFGRNRKDGGSSRSSESKKPVDSVYLKEYNELKKEIAAYENNIMFLNASSKKGNILVDDMNKKIEALKDKLSELAEKMNK